MEDHLAMLSILEKNSDELHYACLIKDYEKVRLLLNAGADIQAKDEINRTPLMVMVAAKYCDPHIVWLLITRGADPNSTDDENFTPLHWAAMFGNGPAVRFLVDHGAFIKPKRSGKFTPLHSAILNGHPDVVKILLKGQLAVKHLTNFKVESLQDIWFCTFLDNKKYDHQSIMNITHQLRELKMLNRIPIKIYKKALLHYADHIQNKDMSYTIQDNEINLFCERYLKYLKKEISTIKVNIQDYPFLTTRELIASIMGAGSFDELPEDMQDIIYDPAYLEILYKTA